MDATENPMNASNISMNVTPVLPVDEEVVPEGDLVQAAGNDVALAPYAYAPYEGDWENNTYWEATGPLDAEAPAAELAVEHGRKPLVTDALWSDGDEDDEADREEAQTKKFRRSKSRRHELEDENDDEEDNEEDPQMKERHHKRHKKRSESENVLDTESLDDKLKLRAYGAAAPDSTEAKPTIAESESGKLLGMAASAQKGVESAI